MIIRAKLIVCAKGSYMKMCFIIKNKHDLFLCVLNCLLCMNTMEWRYLVQEMDLLYYRVIVF
jgi:hypothetical protein